MLTESDETESILKASVETFMRQESAMERLRQVKPGRPAHDRQVWAKLARQGWLAMRLPEQLGGSGLQARHAGAIAAVFGQFLLPEPFVGCALLPGMLAASANRAAAWHDILAALTDGEKVIAVAWQEDPQSLDVCPVRTNAANGPAGLLISGVKAGVVGAAMADDFLVTARLEGQPVLVAVARSAPGVRVETVTTSDGASLGTVYLENAPAQGAVLFEGEALLQALARALDEALLAVAAQLDGMAQAAFEIALDYMRTREQFGQKIGSFQSLQHVAVDLKVQHRLAAASYLSALQKLEAAGDVARHPAAVCAAISAAKARASDSALATARFGVQVHGAIGFAMEADIGLYMKSALRASAWLGNGAQHRRRVSLLLQEQASAARGADA